MYGLTRIYVRSLCEQPGRLLINFYLRHLKSRKTPTDPKDIRPYTYISDMTHFDERDSNPREVDDYFLDYISSKVGSVES